jgi:GTP cyclohydrolase II
MRDKETRGEYPETTSAGVLVPPELRVERAAGDLRRGAPVLIRGSHAGEASIAVSAETVEDGTLRALEKRFGSPSAVITHARASTLKIRLYTPEIVLIPQSKNFSAAALRALADPTTDLDHPLKGPFEASRESPPVAAAASVRLAKLAGLLPATAIFPVKEATSVALELEAALSEVSAADIESFDEVSATHLKLVTRASVPLKNAENAELAAFRPVHGGQEHYALIIGEKGAPGLAPPGPVLTRLHSECFTGDLLGSLKCDCGDQLRGAVAAISVAGGGVLLYLAQEGRGIGLMNKLRAYRLQDEGFDTMEANKRLGFAADERLYDIAARMLKLLGFTKVRLMTNNPEKVRALEQAGIAVVERVPHSFPDNVHNRDYLRTKAEKGGHLF